MFDKNCSIVLFFLTAGYYDAILLLTFDTHKLIISEGFCMEYVTHLREDGSYQPLNNAVG